MKRILLIVLLAIFSTTSAYADRGYGGGHGGGWGHGGGHGGNWGWGGLWVVPALIGSAIVYGLTIPQRVYSESASVYAPSYQPVYELSAAPSPVQSWYFCPAANGYYPYVKACPGGWQAVPATPPR